MKRKLIVESYLSPQTLTPQPRSPKQERHSYQGYLKMKSKEEAKRLVKQNPLLSKSQENTPPFLSF